MVVDPIVSKKIWKPSADVLIQNADVVVFNERGKPEERNYLITKIEGLRHKLDDVLFVPHPHYITQQKTFVEKLCCSLT
jgi:hypothetical protein